MTYHEAERRIGRRVCVQHGPRVFEGILRALRPASPSKHPARADVELRRFNGRTDVARFAVDQLFDCPPHEAF